MASPTLESSSPRPHKKPRHAPVFHATEPIFNCALNQLGGEPMGPSAPLKDTPRLIYVPPKHQPQKTTLTRDQTALDIAAQNAINSPLLRLPDELLIKILEFACSTNHVVELRSTFPTPLGFTTDKEDDETSTNASEHHVAISLFPSMLVSRHIHALTSPIRFSQNTYHCANAWDLSHILPRMRASHVRSIKTFKIRWHTAESILHEAACNDNDFDTSATAFKMLTGLELLEVEEPDKRVTMMGKENVLKGLEKWINGVVKGLTVVLEGKEKDGRDWNGWGYETPRWGW